MSVRLIQSRVKFNPTLHEYTLDGKKLQGITKMLTNQLFPKKYEGVPQEIIDKAAAHGTNIHETLGLMEDLGIESDTPQAENYLLIKEKHNLNYERNEYLVSDNKDFASSIDMVYRDSDDEFTLCDIKTTYKLDKEYVQWQLSIYAYLFELQNPKAKVKRLAGIWLHGFQYEFAEVERIPVETVKELLKCELAGEKFQKTTGISMPEKYRQMEESICEILEQSKLWQQREKALKEGILKQMTLAGEYSWNGDNIIFTRKKETLRKSFDSKAFQKDYPELYEKYVRESPMAGALTIKVKTDNLLR